MTSSATTSVIARPIGYSETDMTAEDWAEPTNEPTTEDVDQAKEEEEE